MTACNRRDLASLAGLHTKAMFPYKFIENQGTEEKAVLNVGKCTSLKLREQEAAVITDCKHPPSCRNFLLLTFAGGSSFACDGVGVTPAASNYSDFALPPLSG